MEYDRGAKTSFGTWLWWHKLVDHSGGCIWGDTGSVRKGERFNLSAFTLRSLKTGRRIDPLKPPIYQCFQRLKNLSIVRVPSRARGLRSASPFHYGPRRADVRRTSCDGRRKADVPRTSCAVSRSFFLSGIKKILTSILYSFIRQLPVMNIQLSVCKI